MDSGAVSGNEAITWECWEVLGLVTAADFPVLDLGSGSSG